MGNTKISWTQATWNPVVGCAHVSAGCDHCYAAREASGRLAHLPQYAGLAEDGRFTGDVRLLHERLDQPRRWKRPRQVFVNSMSDLFHSEVSEPFIATVWWTMAACPQHRFQILTKRPQRMAELLTAEMPWQWGNSDDGLTQLTWPLANVWLGVSIENQTYAWRTRWLAEAAAAHRFVSFEPLLTRIDKVDLTGIEWAIIGSESGSGRPTDPDWVRRLVAICREQGVQVHVKQLFDERSPRRPLRNVDAFPEDLRLRETPVALVPGMPS